MSNTKILLDQMQIFTQSGAPYPETSAAGLQVVADQNTALFSTRSITVADAWNIPAVDKHPVAITKISGGSKIFSHALLPAPFDPNTPVTLYSNHSSSLSWFKITVGTVYNHVVEYAKPSSWTRMTTRYTSSSAVTFTAGYLVSDLKYNIGNQNYVLMKAKNGTGISGALQSIKYNSTFCRTYVSMYLEVGKAQGTTDTANVTCYFSGTFSNRDIMAALGSNDYLDLQKFVPSAGRIAATVLVPKGNLLYLFEMMG